MFFITLTLVTFTMHTPKGEKSAGVVTLQLSRLLNGQKQRMLQEKLTLQKCPVSAYVSLNLTCQAIDAKADTDQLEFSGSKNSFISQTSLSVNKTQQSNQTNQVNSLKMTIEKLKHQNKQLRSKLDSFQGKGKQENSEVLKGQLLKSKNIQMKLQKQVEELNNANFEQQSELQRLRIKLENIYDNFCNSISQLV